jgi:hypothetical protein
MTQDAHNTKVATRAVLATRITIVAALVLGALIVGLQLVTTLQTNEIAKGIEDEQAVSAERGKSIKATAEQVESCTTPGMACFKRSQAATAAAVGSINQVAVYAAACAADVPGELPVRQRVRIIEKCITVLAQQETP